MTKVIVTGGNGQLGQSLAKITPANLDVIFCDRSEFDLTNADSMMRLIRKVEPDCIVNCAAYTNVDGAESDNHQARLVNAEGVATLGELSRISRARVIHISTDFVFDGTATSPYQTDSDTNPTGVYGQTKLEGENELLSILPESGTVIRTSWLYSEFGSNFVKTMLRLFEEKDLFQVVEDQRGSPTYALGLARLIWRIAMSKSSVSGIFHWSDAGVTSWYDFARTIGTRGLDLGLLSRRAELRPISALDYASVAPRPAFSALDCFDTVRKFPDLQQDQWQKNLDQMLLNLKRTSS